MKNDYVIIYSTLNTAEAHSIQFLLRNNGINAIIENEHMTPFFGIVSAKDAEAQILVPSDNEDAAYLLIRNASSIDLSNVRLVTCKRCGETVCDRFDYCWNCMADMKTGEVNQEMQIDDVTNIPKTSGRLPVILFIVLLVCIVSMLAYYTCRFR